MASFELRLTGHVSAAPARVWAHLVDQETVPCWLDGVRSVVADGDEFLAHFHADHGGGWVSGEVVDAAPRERLQLRLESPGANVVEARVAVNLAPDEAGTLLDLRVTGVTSVLGRLVLPLVRFRAEVAMARALRGFRAALEARTRRKRGPFDAVCPEIAEADSTMAAAAAAAS